MGIKDAVGGFFKSAIGSNKDAGLLESLFMESGLGERAEATAVKNLNKKTATQIKNQAEEAYDYVGEINRPGQEAMEGLGATTEIKTGRGAKHDADLKYAAAANVKKGATQQEYDKALKSVNASVGNEKAWEMAKGYYKDPWKRMTDQTLSKQERNLATAQLGARVGATAGGVALTAGMTHDLFANNEDDIGVGGIAATTTEATALGAGAVAGIGLLRKL